MTLFGAEEVLGLGLAWALWPLDLVLEWRAQGLGIEVGCFLWVGRVGFD